MNILANDLLKYHCPHWNEFPEIDLYIDQVVCLLQKNLSLFVKDKSNPIITASMINNYVKQGILKSPIKKKYNKDHLARLFVICIFKRLMSISEIGESIKLMEKLYSVEDGYNIFCDELELAIKATFDPENHKSVTFFETDIREIATLRAIVSAFADSILVDRLILMRNA